MLARFLKTAARALLEPAKSPFPNGVSLLERQVRVRREAALASQEVGLVREHLQGHIDGLRQKAATFQDQAERALAAGSEDRARVALESRREVLQEAQALETHLREVEEEEERLKLLEQRLASQIESYRTQRDVLSARQTAAEAQARVGELIGGIVEESGDLSQALEVTERGRERLRARAAAIGELARSGVLEDPFRPPRRPDIEEELDGLRNKLKLAPSAAASRQLP